MTTKQAADHDPDQLAGQQPQGLAKMATFNRSNDSSALPVARIWFRREEIAPAFSLFHEPYVHSWFRANIWYLKGRELDLLSIVALTLPASRQRWARMQRDLSLLW